MAASPRPQRAGARRVSRFWLLLAFVARVGIVIRVTVAVAENAHDPWAWISVAAAFIVGVGMLVNATLWDLAQR